MRATLFFLILMAPSWTPARAQGKHYKEYTEVRQNAFSETRRFSPRRSDLRGPMDIKRDTELLRHFKRLAELDVIADVFSKDGRDDMVEQADNVRGREMRRHRRAMYHLRQEVLTSLRVAVP